MTERPIVHSDMYSGEGSWTEWNILHHLLNVARVNSGKTIARSRDSEYVYWEERKQSSDVKARIHRSQYYQSAG